MKSREATKRETRDALIRAGVALYIASKGDQPSLDAICAHAGFTRGAFYVHFKDRAEFLLAVIDHVMSGFVEAVVGDGGPLKVPETIGRFVAVAQSQGQQDEPSSLGFLVRALLRYPELNERYVRMLSSTLEGLTVAVNRDQQSGNMRDDVPAGDISTILVTAAMGIASLAHAEVRLDLSRLQNSAAALLGCESVEVEVPVQAPEPELSAPVTPSVAPSVPAEDP